ncbi:MAG: acyl-CoA thioesterase/bile acid-CoA:amino acid N-acyltransferase family protein [Caldilineaceae bacterium]
MPRFQIMPEKSLIDAPVQIRLLGLEPAETIIIQAEFCDDLGQTWASWAKFKVDAQGEIDLDTVKPNDGTYPNADGMGLFWSMQLRTVEDVRPVPFVNTATKSLKPLSINLIAKRQEEIIATAVLERRFLADNVKQIDVRKEGLTATLFVPSTMQRGPAVIVLGGSGGGFGWSHQVAALLASYGCVAIAVAYFDWQGKDNLSNQLIEIPLEYIGSAIQHLLTVKNNLDNLTIIGYSKGAELALVAAVTYLEISRVIAYLPSSVVWHGFQMQGSAQQSSWEYQGQPLPFLSFANGYFDETGWQAVEQVEQARIAVENIRGPILLISATKDTVWPSTKMAGMILQDVKFHDQHQEVKHVRLDGAGHNLSVPFLPTAATGNPEATVNARAEYVAWQAVLGFLNLIT